MQYLEMAITIFVILVAFIIGLFNSYRNMVQQYKLQIEINRKVMDVIKKRAELLSDNIQW